MVVLMQHVPVERTEGGRGGRERAAVWMRIA